MFLVNRLTVINFDIKCQEHFNACGHRGICVNDPGSWHCECKRGYRLNDEGTGCEDVNECRMGEIFY